MLKACHAVTRHAMGQRRKKAGISGLFRTPETLGFSDNEVEVIGIHSWPTTNPK